MFKVISSEPFKKRVKRLNKEHKARIKKFIEKLEREGLHALKILYTKGKILGEMKSMRPPYRLYVIYDQEDKTFYVLRWEHKSKQEKVVNELKRKLEEGIDMGLYHIFGEN